MIEEGIQYPSIVKVETLNGSSRLVVVIVDDSGASVPYGCALAPVEAEPVEDPPS